jgi:hypothetical protein
MPTRRELLVWLAAFGAGDALVSHTLSAKELTMKNIEKEIQRLLDRVEIDELMARYCRHADLLDAEGIAACFTDDCIVAYVPASIAAPARSKQELLGFLRQYFPNSVSSSHYVTNVEMVFDDPDHATASTYMYSWQRFKGYPEAADCHRFGRYEFRLVRTAEGWRFSRLNLLSAGEYGGTRISEQFNRPWPPKFD